MSNSITEYKKWLANKDLDAELREELTAIENDPKEIEERFAFPLAFGTGGLRSKMGAGCGMMNIYTVAQSTEGVARVIDSLGEDAKKRGVMLGYDSRHNSALFARRCAEVLTAHGIKCYMFDELRPTPMLSAGVRHFGSHDDIAQRSADRHLRY